TLGFSRRDAGYVLVTSVPTIFRSSPRAATISLTVPFSETIRVLSVRTCPPAFSPSRGPGPQAPARNSREVRNSEAGLVFGRSRAGDEGRTTGKGPVRRSNRAV